MSGSETTTFRRIAPLILVSAAILAFRAFKRCDSNQPEAQPAPTAAKAQAPIAPSTPPTKPQARQPDQDRPQPSAKTGAKPTSAPGSPASALKIFNWNLQNFSGIDSQKRWRDIQKGPEHGGDKPKLASDRPPRRHNLAKIKSIIAERDPDIITFQEVVDKAAVNRVFGQYAWQFSRHGGRGKQFLALGYKKQSKVQCRAQPDIEGLSARKTVRPGLRARCQHPKYADFQVIVVHLKAGPKGYTLREHQGQVLFDVLRSSSIDTVITGDWNFSGDGHIDGRSERQRFAQRAQTRAQLLESKLDLPCTSYWPGKERRDGKMETSVLDGFWVRGFGPSAAPPPTEVLGACRDQKCRPLRGDPGIPTELRGLSDHCPLALHL